MTTSNGILQDDSEMAFWSRAARKDGRAEGWQMTERGGIVIERDLMVPARDGVRLATDVYRPEGPGPVSGAPRTHAVRQIGGEPIRAHRR